MKSINAILDVNHSNMYVHRVKLITAISELRVIYGHQIHSNKILYSFEDLKFHINKLQNKLTHIETTINFTEQSAFSFGL